MFSVYGRSPESKLMSIKPHSLRHLMNTEMFRKNVPDTIITHQFGRRTVAQSYEYDHRNLAEKLSFVKLPPAASKVLPAGSAKELVGKMVVSGMALQSHLGQSFKRIQHESGDEAAFIYLAANADGFHVTPYGFCTNSFSVNPCTRHLKCFERCRSVWSDSVHPIHKQFTVAEMLELERPHLMSMPVLFDGYVEKPARVSSTCLVAVARNRYSVPCEWAGHLVSTRLYPNRVDIACAQTIIASHARTPGSGQVTYDWQHYIELVQRKPGALRNGAPFLDLPEPLQRLRKSLLRHPGGDRTMAQVLASVPQAGLDAVLVAVDLVLEGATPNGSVSAEHVRNVLARLNAPPRPEHARTTLQLTNLPLADTARYDRLRPTHNDNQGVIHV